MNTVKAKCPEAVVREIMEITAVIDGRDELEGCEVVLETAGTKEVEITVAPDGSILEGPREEDK